MTLYTIRPAAVEARLYSGVNSHELRSWLMGGDHSPEAVLVRAGGALTIVTDSGAIDVPAGHHVIRHTGGKLEAVSPAGLAAGYDLALPEMIPAATTEAGGIITGFFPYDGVANAALKPGETAGRSVISLELDEFFSLPGRDLATKSFAKAFDAARAAGTEVIIRRAGKERPLLQTRGRS